MKIAIRNIVITVMYPKTIFDLNFIYVHLPVDRTVYDPWSFPAVRYHGEYTCMIYRTGKIIIPGVHTLNDIKAASDWITEKLASIVGQLPKPKVKISNIVAVANFERELDIEALSLNRGVVYEPDTFPGAMLQYEKKQFLVFRSGKVVLPGFKSVEEMDEAVKWLEKRLEVI